MTPPCIVTARRFLSLLTEGAAPSAADLARGLDELALAYHQTPDEFDLVEVEPPTRNYEPYYKELSARFPEFGYYADSDSSEVVQVEPLVGDAIDDLADIGLELQETLWR